MPPFRNTPPRPTDCPPIANRCQAICGQKQILIAVLALLAIVAAAYHHTLQNPFVFDDILSIQDNPSIREWKTALSPGMDQGETASGRPILNLTFAINYKISGLKVWSYHAGNILIHALAGLVLFGIVRRTLLLPGLRDRFGHAALMIGWLTAAIWLAHPLTTEAVTYTVQRAESLMALFYLLTLYCFIRAATAEEPRNAKSRQLWFLLSWLACLAGMATKEVIISAPVIIALYDAAFLSGSIRETFRQRWRWYCAYALTWIVLVFLITSTGNRGGTVGFSADPEITWRPYMLTQCWAFVRYLRLAIFPHPLVFDYGLYVYREETQVWWQMLFVAAFTVACFLLYKKRPRAGWLGLFYLAVLAPTTTVIPVATQVIAEHRMYLPLAAIVTTAVLAGYYCLSKRVLWVGLIIVVAFTIATYMRNKVYNSDDTLWADVVEKYPLNARANGNVGNMLVRAGRATEALPYLERAIQLHPSRGDHYNNLGYAYARMGDYKNAIHYYEEASRRKISQQEVFYANYCRALLKLERYDEAMTTARRLLTLDAENTTALVTMGNAHRARHELAAAEMYFKKALEIDDKNPEAWNNWGNIKALEGGQLDTALEYYKKAAALAPQSAEIQENVARLLSQLRREEEALPYFAMQIKAAPNDHQTRQNYADALYETGRYSEAAEQYKIYLQSIPTGQKHVGQQTVALMVAGKTEAARILAQAMTEAVPGNATNEFLLANILLTLKRGEESLLHYQTALDIDPLRVSIRYNYATALMQCERYSEAALQYETLLKQDPGKAIICHGYALALEKLGRIEEAMQQEQEALRLQPGFQEAKQSRERLSKQMTQ